MHDASKVQLVAEKMGSSDEARPRKHCWFTSDLR